MEKVGEKKCSVIQAPVSEMISGVEHVWFRVAVEEKKPLRLSLDRIADVSDAHGFLHLVLKMAVFPDLNANSKKP